MSFQCLALTTHTHRDIHTYSHMDTIYSSAEWTRCTKDFYILSENKTITCFASGILTIRILYLTRLFVFFLCAWRCHNVLAIAGLCFAILCIVLCFLLIVFFFLFTPFSLFLWKLVNRAFKLKRFKSLRALWQLSLCSSNPPTSEATKALMDPSSHCDNLLRPPDSTVQYV